MNDKRGSPTGNPENPYSEAYKGSIVRTSGCGPHARVNASDRHSGGRRRCA